MLLLVMNRFFHKIYWTVWIGAHNKKKSELIRSSSSRSASATYMGLAMFGMVLIVMVGENVQEMQQAGWIETTDIGFSLPSWFGMWFAVFPNFEGIIAQILAALFVIASYFITEYMRSWRPRKQARLNQAH